MIFKQISVLALIMTHGFISLLSKRSSTVQILHVAKAFSTSTISINNLDGTSARNNRNTVTGNLLVNNKNGVTISDPAVFPLNARTVSARFMSATVEEDLDTALDNILGDVYDSKNGKKNGKKNGEAHMEGSKPMPKELVEQVSLLAVCWEQIVDRDLFLTLA